MKSDQSQVQEALAALIRQAERQETVTYSDLAQELGISNPRNVGRVLYAVADSLPAGTPPLTVIVVGKTTGKPSWGMGEIVPDYEQQVERLQASVFNHDWSRGSAKYRPG